jgi:hypothetical protein
MSVTKGRRIISSCCCGTYCLVAKGQGCGFVGVPSCHAQEAFCVGRRDAQFLQLADIGVLRYDVGVGVEAIDSAHGGRYGSRHRPILRCGGVFRGFCTAAFYYRSKRFELVLGSVPMAFSPVTKKCSRTAAHWPWLYPRNTHFKGDLSGCPSTGTAATTCLLALVRGAEDPGQVRVGERDAATCTRAEGDGAR